MPKHAGGDGFGGRLRELREAAGFTQDQLASRIGYHKLSVAKLEQGVRGPAWSTVLLLAEALGVDVSAFRPPDGRPGKPAPRRARGRPKRQE